MKIVIITKYTYITVSCSLTTKSADKPTIMQQIIKIDKIFDYLIKLLPYIVPVHEFGYLLDLICLLETADALNIS